MPADVLESPFVLEYTYKRSTGPVIGRFLTGLRAGKIEGVRTRSGKVLIPPTEYDPATGEAIEDWVEVGQQGEVLTWTWVSDPEPAHPLEKPFAWALIRLDGADTALLHAVDAPRDDMVTGLRVRVRWTPEPIGSIRDIACFEVVDG